MTSPAQLKYLDAMGIPVWISRDLVVVKEQTDLPTEALNENHLNKAIDSNLSDKPQNAQNILASLEAESQKKNASNTTGNTKNNQLNNGRQQQSKEKIENAVTQIVESTTLEKDHIDTSTLPHKSPSKGDTANLLDQTPHHYIYAEGSESADWMIVGHSPESYNGLGREPFAGDSGILLDNMLRAVGIEKPRQKAFIINVLDVNHDAEEAEIQKQVEALLQQKLLSLIDKIKPKILLLVGQIAAQNILGSDDPLIIMRAKSHLVAEAKIPCVVTYYPSYLLLKPIDKRKAWEDLQLAMRLID